MSFRTALVLGKRKVAIGSGQGCGDLGVIDELDDDELEDEIQTPVRY